MRCRRRSPFAEVQGGGGGGGRLEEGRSRNTDQPLGRSTPDPGTATRPHFSRRLASRGQLEDISRDLEGSRGNLEGISWRGAWAPRCSSSRSAAPSSSPACAGAGPRRRRARAPPRSRTPPLRRRRCCSTPGGGRGTGSAESVRESRHLSRTRLGGRLCPQRRGGVSPHKGVCCMRRGWVREGVGRLRGGVVGEGAQQSGGIRVQRLRVSHGVDRAGE